MKNMSGKIVAWLNDVARDYVYGTRERSKLMRIARIALLAVIATVVGDAYARYMVPVPMPVESSGTFLDGYMHRYWFEVGAVMFVFAFAVVRYLFRALCRAYVRRLDRGEAIANGSGEMKCAGDGNTKPTEGASRVERRAGVNGDYVSAVDNSEDTISESEGGDV